ncbi:MAG: HD domain-containing protein [Desulfovibrionaceae bacterium]
MTRDQTASSALADLRRRREDASSSACQPDYSARAAGFVDRYFQARLAEAPAFLRSPVLIAAVGGYGRGELTLASDVDVLLVYAQDIPAKAEDLVSHLLHPLWDEKFRVGHGVRTVRDCVELAAQDARVYTSLLDFRRIAGDASIASTLREALEPRELEALAPEWSPIRFAQWLQQERAERTARFGELALLSPDIKNGPGGLRDLHHARWLALVFHGAPVWPGLFTDRNREELRASEELLSRCRNALHCLARSAGDELPLDLQPEIALLLGYPDDNPARRAESFLADLHQSMALIRRAQAAVSRLALHGAEPAQPAGPNLIAKANALDFEDYGQVRGNPQNLLTIFEAQSRQGLDLSWPARTLARELAQTAAQTLLSSPGLPRRLTRLFSGPHAEKAGREMLDFGVLGALIPELEARRRLVQFDDFHLHPLGPHTVKTVARLAELLRGDDTGLTRWLADIDDTEPLILAGLLHDIGKGQPGDHARTGAEMSGPILERLGASENVADDVRFLVENHLLLFEASRTLDLSDETALWRLAARIRTRRRLAMLTLFSAADASATGPRAWDGWTAALLRELADKLANMLTHGPLADPYAASVILARRDKVRSLAKDRLPPHFVEGVLDALDPRYALVHSPQDIVKDLVLLERLEKEVEQNRRRTPGGRGERGVCVVRTEPGVADRTHRAALAAMEQPGLFTALTGVFSLLSVDVLDACAYTFGRGLALYLFTVSMAQTQLPPEEIFERVRYSVRAALTGKLSLDFRIKEKRSSPLAPKPSGPAVSPEVLVDNGASDFFTVVDVRAKDRLGLLYDMVNTLSQMGLKVHLARITTRADVVADLFFVRSYLGEKLEDPERVETLVRALTRAAGE